MRISEKITSLLLSVAMLFAVTFSVAAGAEGTGSTPVIRVGNASAGAGEDVEVKITVENNPGIAGIGLIVEFDDKVLTLKEAVYSSSWRGSGIDPAKNGSPASLIWFNASDHKKDGVFATLRFSVAEDAKSTVTDIRISYRKGNISDQYGNDVDPTTVNGTVTVTGKAGDEFLPDTDMNGDGRTDVFDLFLLITAILNVRDRTGADINGDGKVGIGDAVFFIRLLCKNAARRYAKT